MPKKWKCTVCGYIHEGKTPPDVCPVCGAFKYQFILYEDLPKDLEKRLREAFAGESKASVRNTAFAKQADKEGYPQIARLFRPVADAEKVFKIPDSIPLRNAALTELYSLGVHAVRRAMIEPGDKVVILGAGRLGLSVLESMKQTGTTWVCSVDLLENRLEIAQKIGADLTINAREKDPVEEILSLTGGFGVDRVIEAVGAVTEVPNRMWPMAQAVRIVRYGGRIVVMGQGAQSSPVLWRDVVMKEAQIVGGRVTLGDFPRTLRLMPQGRFHPDLIISGERSLEKTGEAFELLEEEPDRYLKFLIKVA